MLAREVFDDIEHLFERIGSLVIERIAFVAVASRHRKPHAEGRLDVRDDDHYLQDASYIRLKNITIDYTFPKHICKKLRLEGLKVYLSGENLFTHSPMFKHTDMFDPEVITSGDSDFAASTTSGLNGTGNGYSYPMLKTVTLGINVTF